MRRVYRNVLLLSIIIQLSVFFMCTIAILWIDELFNGSIGLLAKLATLHKVVFITILIVSTSLPCSCALSYARFAQQLLWPWLATVFKLSFKSLHAYMKHSRVGLPCGES
jgi:hypothetical protein